MIQLYPTRSLPPVALHGCFLTEGTGLVNEIILQTSVLFQSWSTNGRVIMTVSVFLANCIVVIKPMIMIWYVARLGKS